MSDIHIHRPHALGLPAARQAARRWADKAERKLDMECRYEEGDTADTLHFARAGITGTLQVDAGQFALHAELGFLFSAFKERIASEISEQLDKAMHAPDVNAPPTA